MNCMPVTEDVVIYLTMLDDSHVEPAELVKAMDDVKVVEWVQFVVVA